MYSALKAKIINNFEEILLLEYLQNFLKKI